MLVLSTLVLGLIDQNPAQAQTKPSGAITVWAWKPVWDGINGAKLLDAFAAQYPDVKVNSVVYATGDVYQKLQVALSAGTGAPDVVLLEDSHIGQFVDLGGLSDITDLVKPYTDKIVPYKFEQVTKDNKVYGMPWDVGPVVTYYRTDVFQKAGLSTKADDVSKMVDTWDDYLQTCQTILAKTQLKCMPLSKANNDARVYEMMLWQQGLGYTDSKGNVSVDSPDNIATLQELGKFWAAGVTSDEQPWTDAWYADFSSTDKPVASLVEAAWMGGNYKGWIAPKTGGDWGVALMPAMKAGQARSANDGGSTFAIPVQTQNKDAAWAFIQFLVGNAANNNALYKSSNIFPGLIDAYTNNDLYNQPDPFFNGQVVGKIYVDVAKQIPAATIYGTHYQEISGFVATAIQKYATGAASAADALKEAADAIRSSTGLS
ncbi:MAG: ABC transporter substrate-binding protein [Aggregatilineales bacterium]